MPEKIYARWIRWIGMDELGWEPAPAASQQPSSAAARLIALLASWTMT